MMSVELKHHPEEWFFLHNFDIDKVFSTIQRADYLILYYIKMQANSTRTVRFIWLSLLPLWA